MREGDSGRWASFSCYRVAFGAPRLMPAFRQTSRLLVILRRGAATEVALSTPKDLPVLKVPVSR